VLGEIYLLYVSNTCHAYESRVCLGTFVFVGSGHVVSMFLSYKIYHFDNSCDKVMKFEFFYEK
jgi:hypothetical protein